MNETPPRSRRGEEGAVGGYDGGRYTWEEPGGKEEKRELNNVWRSKKIEEKVAEQGIIETAVKNKKK